MQDLIAGQVGVSFAGILNVLGHVKSRLRALGVTTAALAASFLIPTSKPVSATRPLFGSAPRDAGRDAAAEPRGRQGVKRPRGAGELPRRGRRGDVYGPAGAECLHTRRA